MCVCVGGGGNVNKRRQFKPFTIGLVRNRAEGVARQRLFSASHTRDSKTSDNTPSHSVSPRFDFLSWSSTLHPETSFPNLLLKPPPRCLQAKTSNHPVFANVSLPWKCRKHMVSLCSAVGTAAAQWNVTDLVTLVTRKIKETERTNKIGNKLRISLSHLSSHRFWNSEAMVTYRH